jgi:hypothetical protein
VFLHCPITNCGQSPWKQPVWRFVFVRKIGKAMGKPSSINDEQNDKRQQKQWLLKDRLLLKDLWQRVQLNLGLLVRDRSFEDSLKYWEVVRTNQPKVILMLVSGRGKVFSDMTEHMTLQLA